MAKDVSKPSREQLQLLRDKVAALRKAEVLKEQAEAQLRAQENITNEILDAVAAGLIRVDKTGHIIYANAHALRLAELKPQADGTMSLRQFSEHTILPDGRPIGYEDYPTVRCLRTGEVQSDFILGLKREGADVLWLHITAAPEIDSETGEVLGVISTFTDTSRSIQIERSLRESEDRYRGLVEQAPDAIVVHRNGTVVYVNEAGVKLWGASSREDFIGRNVMDFAHPDDLSLVKRRIQKTMVGEAVPLVEQRSVRKDGSVVHVEVVGSACTYDGQASVQTIVRDVTERKRAERQIRRQREILKRFFERIPLFVALFDSSDKVTLVNRQWKKVLGRAKGVTIRELLHRFYPDAEDRQKVIDYLRETPPEWLDLRTRVKDGSTRDISWAYMVLTDGTQIAIGQDITRRKAAELVLKRSTVELEHLVKARTEELSRKNQELQTEVEERRKAEALLQDKQQFMEQMLTTHERDRKLVAYEIHDTFVQDVVAALMFLDAYRASVESPDAQNLEQLDQSRNLLRKAIDEARAMISGLRPPIIDEQGIVAAVEYLVCEMNARGLEISVTAMLNVQRLAPVVESTMFRIVQEALTNLERHSRSRVGDVQIMQIDDTIRLEIRDYGVGFDPQNVPEGHYGLKGIRERANLIGGTASIKSALGEGTDVVVEIPVSRNRWSEDDDSRDE